LKDDNEKVKDEVKKPTNWLESLNYAIEGVIYAIRTQRNIRYHYIIATIVLLSSIFLRLSATEFMLLVISVVFLLFAEMMNTAVEETVNLLEAKYNVFAKNAKDVSAGAVLISSISVAVMGYILFSKYLDTPLSFVLQETKEYSGHLALVALLLVVIGVVVLKAYLGKGKPLHGGMPSGHSAVAFSLWVSVLLLTSDPLVSLLTFVMAAMVSHSRLEAGIHTRLEVVFGALLGIGMTFLVFYIYSFSLK